MIKILRNYVENEGLDWFKIEMLVGLIYLNMAPLHHFPFDKMLYSLGSSVIHDALKVENGNA